MYYKAWTITTDAWIVATAIASASVFDASVGYPTFHVDLAS